MTDAVPDPPRPPLTFERSHPLPASAAEAFAWHERPGALVRLLPPWQDVSIESAPGHIREGAEVVLKLKAGPAFVRWHALHTAYENRGADGGMFQDVQTKGPFTFWEHTHHVDPAPGGASLLRDVVRYLPPGGPLGQALGKGFAERQLDAMFDYRHAVTAADLAAHGRFRNRPRLNVLISGAGGLIGRQLVAFLTGGGHRVAALSRSGGPDTIQWDPESGELPAKKLAGFDAVVHLAGEPVQGRWTEEKKRRIRDSRVKGTRLLAETLASLESPPRVLVCASATGLYGDRGDEALTEQSPPGEGFLADVCREWEAAADPAREAGIRVAHARFGIVLSPEGGALGKQLPIFKAGGGGPVGGGEQWWSWVGRDDVVGALHHVLMTDDLSGPINVTAPGTVTNAAFTQTLAETLNRPALVPVPAFAVRLAFGEMGEELLLASARVKPTALLGSGYAFRETGLKAALRRLLGRTV
ncbi:TIGR01777 family oxidoreductase [Alienimonas californiensis]|uniref:Epimerase family protein n=1 Tax=Alienimonas californiensis TaxID=2527989 RepID=A0A517PCA1_9PLAN|nr:TIGR01777 family oxidoreductase [Alienimonas californiensis]QDT16986.1 Epimerase family protein [Alienimonas californiensis]